MRCLPNINNKREMKRSIKVFLVSFLIGAVFVIWRIIPFSPLDQLLSSGLSHQNLFFFCVRMVGEFILLSLLTSCYFWLWLRRPDWMIRSLMMITLIVFVWRCTVLYHEEMGMDIFLQTSMQSSVEDQVKLYIDRGQGFKETEAISTYVRPESQYRNHLFRLPSRSIINELRFDPFTIAGTMRIRDMAIVNGNGRCVETIDLGQWHPANQIREFKLHNNELTLVAEEDADDPQIAFKFSDPLMLDRIRSDMADAFLARAMIELMIMIASTFLLALAGKKLRRSSVTTIKKSYYVVMSLMAIMIGIGLFNIPFSDFNRTIYTNKPELIIVLFSIVILTLFTYLQFRSVKKSLILALLIILPLAIAVEGTTQFLTTDEISMAREVFDLDKSDMSIWYFIGVDGAGSNRTSDAVIGMIIHFLKMFHLIDGKNHDLLYMTVKVIHWSIGFLMILVIFWLLNRYFIKKTESFLFFILYLFSTLLASSTIIALKVANHDLLAMMLGMCALLLTIAAYTERKSTLCLAAIVVAMLGTQEKMIAAPMLIFATICYVYLKLIENPNRSFGSLLICSYYNSIIATTVAVLTSLFTFAFVGIVVRGGNLPEISYSAITGPLVSYMRPIVRAMEGRDFLTMRFDIESLSLLHVNVIALSAIMLHVIAKRRKIIQNMIEAFRTPYFFIPIGILLIGIMTSYKLESFIYPIDSPPAGTYLPSISWHGLITYYKAKTFIEHQLFYIFSSIGEYVFVMPTMTLIALLVGIFYAAHYFKMRDEYFKFQIIMLASLLMPVLYGILSVPISSRYFNLYIFIVIIIGTINITHLICQNQGMKRYLAASLFITVTLFEILPFRPYIGFYLPLWYNVNYSVYKDVYNQPRPGKAYLGWGWGEEYFLAGSKIDAILSNNEKASDKRIHGSYYGKWINAPLYAKQKVHYTEYDMFLRTGNLTDSDYMIFTRAPIAQRWATLPQDITPFFTIEHRGITQVWIFRGDQLTAQRSVPKKG
jgi:hypothetical protein